MAFLYQLVLVLLIAVAVSSQTSKETNKTELAQYIADKRETINQRYKLLYHVTPPVGWMNDPNGFSFYKGEYHLFYQFYPYDSVWGAMHWGHSTSPNLVDWKEQPTALIPEKEQCFSGSGVVDGDQLVLMYTGHEDRDTPPYYRETQYLAFSNDGINFEKYEGNPVLLPSGSPDFRDPKVWRHGDHWYVVLGSKSDDLQRGRVLLYRSTDLKNWEFLSVIGESDGTLGYMWECPDFFELDGKYILLMSPQGMEPQGDRYKNIFQTGYIIGNFNYETFEFVTEVEFQEIDFGHDFYATQTIDNDGKRYMVGWFGMWEVPHPEAVDGWAGAMTIIRELKLVGDRIVQIPVEAMVTLREQGTTTSWAPNTTIEFQKTGEIIVNGTLNQTIELLIEGKDGGEKAWLTWDPVVGKVIVDRGSKSNDTRQVEWAPISSHSWRIFLDASSLELFCGEGEVVFSSRVYPVVSFCVIAAVTSKSFRQHDSVLEVEEYIANKKADINPRYRLHYHVSPPVGWMNDPNGFSFYKGEYHLFYQFYPYDSVWGPMHWGHVSSPNLVEWQQLPTALIPEQEMCFSGSGVVDGDQLVLMYTGRINLDVEPFYNETQYLAYSDDGVTFQKYEGNPVLPAAPNGSPDFRDPKVWKYEDHWYVVIGSKTDDERGRVLLYRSPDLKTWEFLSIIGESQGDMGYMWECPDFFELDGKFILLMSPQGLESQGDRYKNTYQTGYIIGSFNYETFEFVPEVEFQEIDFGHDFYATQSMEKDGKRYVIGWFSMWDVPLPEDVDGWAGTMTIVRELNLVGDRVIMKPIDEMVILREQNLFTGALEPNSVVEFEKTGEIIVNGDLSQNIELLIEGSNGGGKAWVRWDAGEGKVIVDRGSDDVRQVEWEPIKSHSWRIFLDASSLELFCGEGEVVFSSRVYPDGDWRVTNLSPQTLDIEAYHLRRSVPE
ncbi:uncharacterized protein LOC114359219 [Ostrinia furnacalis]|uniref:uncharacterized protein LOC114359219 n=1 Tax=Ostrinia furnacalis TaxID=93504 RepID=UPI001038B6F4|nr:uncharacterized protein LOC114359219 [Ostrinia furnacalis]